MISTKPGLVDFTKTDPDIADAQTNLLQKHGLVPKSGTWYEFMRVLSFNTLRDFWTVHPETEASLKHWYRMASAAEWKTPMDVIKCFSKAKGINNQRVRFEVAGGNYRMIVAFHFSLQIAFVKFIGTHTEYDAIEDVTTVSRF